MDHAVALVQAYLHVNGYFTIAELPVLVPLTAGGVKSGTDIDLLALRLRGAGGGAAGGAVARCEPDAALGIPDTAVDMLIVEVKEGRAELNRGATSPETLGAALDRFGLDARAEGGMPFRDLEREGEGRWPGDVSVRMLAFGSVVDPRLVTGFRAVSLPHVGRYLSDYLQSEWEALRHAHFKDRAIGLLALFEQVRRIPAEPSDLEAGAGSAPVEGRSRG